MNVAIDNQPKPLTFGRIVRRLPLYFGLAFAGLAVVTATLALSIHFGVTEYVIGRWIAFGIYSGGLFWIVVRQSKPHWYRWEFWLAVLGMLVTHSFVFIAILRVYPEWHGIWFWPITIIEAGVIGSTLEWLFPERHKRHHRGVEL